jgi:Heterokaryon incompatibility protein (HET)
VQYTNTFNTKKKTRHNLGTDLRIIDVQIMKLHTPPTDSKYIALSYQWGKISRPMALKSNVHLLSENGEINEEDLPLTVRDAIHLCRDMGWRYLSVDALFIIQDNEESRSVQVSCMQAIYLYAELTIVAAGGIDENASLSGVGSPRKVSQIVEM